MQRLYDLGARRVLVTGTGPLGCVPAELALRSRNGECSAELNRAAALFNPQLVEIINQLNSEIGSEVFVSANAFDMHMDFISDPQAYGTSTSIYNLFFHKKRRSYYKIDGVKYSKNHPKNSDLSSFTNFKILGLFSTSESCSKKN